MSRNMKIDYVELPASDFSSQEVFFQSVFDWSFTSYGNEYHAFAGGGLDGGFYKSEAKSLAADGAALVVFFAEDLEAAEEKIKAAGGEISTATFSFPGGRRFHFKDPHGNEYAVWTEV